MTVEVLKFYFEKQGKKKEKVTRKKVSSALWKNLYVLSEEEKARHNYMEIKKTMQDYFLTFSDLKKVGKDGTYVLYFMTPSPEARVEVIRALEPGMKVGKSIMKLLDVDIIKYNVRKRDTYVTLSPILVTRDGEYYLPWEIDFYKNLLGYLEIKYARFTGEHANLKKSNFHIEPLFSRHVKIKFQKQEIYGADMIFRLFLTDETIPVAETLIQLGFGTKTGMGYGFVIPRWVLRMEKIEELMWPVHEER